MHKKTNNSKKIKSTLATIAVISSLAASAHIIPETAKYGNFIDDFSAKTIVYEQDDFVPAGYFNEHPIVVAVSNDFSDEEYEKIEKGIKNLDDYAEGLKFDIVRTSEKILNGDEQILILKDVEKKYTDISTNGVGLNFGYKILDPEAYYSGCVYINENLSTNIIESTVVHELLHVLRFKHEKDHRSIMYKYSGVVNKQLTEQDIKNINAKFPAAEL